MVFLSVKISVQSMDYKIPIFYSIVEFSIYLMVLSRLTLTIFLDLTTFKRTLFSVSIEGFVLEE